MERTAVVITLTPFTAVFFFTVSSSRLTLTITTNTFSSSRTYKCRIFSERRDTNDHKYIHLQPTVDWVIVV
jgi:hypothetical protein